VENHGLQKSRLFSRQNRRQEKLGLRQTISKTSPTRPPSSTSGTDRIIEDLKSPATMSTAHLVQLPGGAPRTKSNAKKILEAVDSRKDVDAFIPLNVRDA